MRAAMIVKFNSPKGAGLEFQICATQLAEPPIRRIPPLLVGPINDRLGPAIDHLEIGRHRE
jgi:hypothetical protein